MDEKQYLIDEYKNQLNRVHEELSYHFAEIKRLKSLEKKYQLMLNAINSYQLPISFYEK